MSWTTIHIGYGPFRLKDLLLGEEFRLSDGTLCKVSKRNRLVPRAESISVRVYYGTLNDANKSLHPTARVYAVCPDQAKRIARRVASRKKKGGDP